MTITPYEHYQDSNILWIDKYPSHWTLTRVKYEAYVKARVGWHGLKSDDFTDEGPYLVTGSDFVGPKIKWQNCYHCDLPRYEQDPYIQLKNGDLLITKDGTIGKVALVDNLKTDDKATLNSGVFVVRPLADNFTTKFYFWLLQSSVFKTFVDFNKTGSTIVHLYQDTFVNFSYASPEIKEQTQIAAFLDHETAKIDTLIKKQQQLIELLKEKRQAVISHAVTKGLNPDAPMKDSGVEWLGEVPEHWDVLQFRRISSLSQGLQIPQSERFYEPLKNCIEYITIKSINAGNSSEHKEYIHNPSDRVICGIDDVLLARTGATGEVVTNVTGAFHNNFFKVKYSSAILKYFLVNLLSVKELKSHLLMLAGTTTIPDLNHGAFLNTKVPLPPLNEQSKIINEINAKNKKFNQLLDVAKNQISLLNERRTALISAAVTGKIDVRNWVAPTTSSDTNEVQQEATA
ncbi:restriction endonuclease subunit S [Aliivibrio fischeri]|uniref:restriction endonuclease subunit S n=1 Tax=Aliivibrio fischeri TaxID=668 RepID=UPI003554483A